MVRVAPIIIPLYPMLCDTYPGKETYFASAPPAS